MRKPKKDGRSLNCIIERELFEQLEVYCSNVGQTKTIAVERALAVYLGEYEETQKQLKALNMVSGIQVMKEK